MYPIFPGRIWLSGKLTASVLLKGLDVKLGCPTSPRAVAEFRPFSNAPAKSFRWFYLDFSKAYKTSNCLSAFRCAREDSSCCCRSDTGQGCNKRQKSRLWTQPQEPQFQHAASATLKEAVVQALLVYRPSAGHILSIHSAQMQRLN